MNCGALGLDWERLSLSSYLEAMTAQSSDGKDEKPEVAESPRMMRFLAAHKDAN